LFTTKPKGGQKPMFAPIITITRTIMGTKEFNQLRGNMIGLHCKVITNFCNSFGINSKDRQNLIKIAKSNGKILGLLA
jgi:hypothetical protein